MRALLLSLLLTVAATPALAQAPVLASHRAVYDLALASAASGSGIVGARGRLALEWADACDGYTLHQRVRNIVERAEGADVVDLTVSTWEAGDGSAFRFSSRHVVNDETVEEIRGRAHIRGDDRVASFAKPRRTALELPAGTMFPTRHTLELITRAALGATFVEATVFDGASAEGIQRTGAVILGFHAAGTYRGEGETTLARLRSWRVRLAYFKHGDGRADSQPEYEIGFRLFENGVSTDVLLDYGDFALKGVLRLFEPLPSDC